MALSLQWIEEYAYLGRKEAEVLKKEDLICLNLNKIKIPQLSKKAFLD